MTDRRMKFAPRQVSQDWDSVEMERYWRPVFDKYDLDKDGYIPLIYLKTVLKSDEALRHDFPDEVIEEILEWADINSDGRLSYDEFLRMVYARELGEARPRFQRIVRFAALTVVPKSQQAITVRRYIEEYNCYPPPIFLLLISLVEIIIFIYYCVKLGELSASGPVPINSVLIYNPYRRYEAWRYLTYMFIHAGGVHIFFNLLIQLMLGVPLEMVHKGWRVMLVYLGGVVAGKTCCKSALKGEECCPVNSKCDTQSGCIQNSTQLVKSVKRQRLGVCPFPQTTCYSTLFFDMCCPLPNAECCLDFVHCCPEDYICDLVDMLCVKIDPPDPPTTTEQNRLH